MHQAGAAVADRSASLRVQCGPSGPHSPPAAYRFIYDGPGLGAPHQPHRGGPRGHRVVGGIPAQLERAGYLPVAAAALGFATDASGVGLRAAFGLKWLYAAWPSAFRAYHVIVLELFTLAVAVHCGGEEWHDTPILLHTDNMPVVPVWTTGTCTCPHMPLVRRLFFSLPSGT